ncbi:hypothetical protein B0O99DRAFT_691741 [Bisporella sp. PMI_857]|nr:hypothetical protein B0O99DRAFT_691741 [Bisporella sp. PMI_857]
MSSHSSTPRPNKVSKRKLTSSASPRPFSARQQDAQARHKDPYPSDSSSDSAAWEGYGGRYDAYGNDYVTTQIRREAAIILDTPELLMMHAQARNDSIPGTRYYFTKRMCGYISKEELEEELKRHDLGKAKSGKGKSSK